MEEVNTVEDLSSKIAVDDERNNDKIALFVYANWHPPALQLKALMPHLVKDFGNDIVLLKCDADSAQELVKHVGVDLLPSFIFYCAGKQVSVLNGCDPPALIQRLNDFRDGKLSAPTTTGEDTAEHKLERRLKALTTANPVMLFMKGTRQQPFCKFSKETLLLLGKYDVEFGTFDIFQDEAVRAGLKTFSEWPTFPQLYVNGEFIGGIDILKEMDKDGSLNGLFSKAMNVSAHALDARLESLVREKSVMLFMKGSPDAPQCKFSREIIGILKSTGIEFGHFDILKDDAVRQQLKVKSNWPTYPQLYNEGSLVGGIDIVREIIQTGGGIEALKAELQPSAAPKH